MKFLWEEKDIKCGQRVGVEGTQERFIIGYIAAGESKMNYCMISLTDGMVFLDGKTTAEIAHALNAGSYAPEQMLPRVKE